MGPSLSSFAPALGLLLLMGLLAWAVHWIKKRTSPVGSGQGAQLRVVSQLMVGPQQRVVVVEIDGPEGQVQLTLGVTPQHISPLHTQHVSAKPAYRQVAEAIDAAAVKGRDA